MTETPSICEKVSLIKINNFYSPKTLSRMKKVKYKENYSLVTCLIKAFYLEINKSLPAQQETKSPIKNDNILAQNSLTKIYSGK